MDGFSPEEMEAFFASEAFSAAMDEVASVAHAEEIGRPRAADDYQLEHNSPVRDESYSAFLSMHTQESDRTFLDENAEHAQESDHIPLDMSMDGVQETDAYSSDSDYSMLDVEALLGTVSAADFVQHTDIQTDPGWPVPMDDDVYELLSEASKGKAAPAA